MMVEIAMTRNSRGQSQLSAVSMHDWYTLEKVTVAAALTQTIQIQNIKARMF